jgi:hypothetical protein
MLQNELRTIGNQIGKIFYILLVIFLRLNKVILHKEEHRPTRCGAHTYNRSTQEADAGGS